MEIKSLGLNILIVEDNLGDFMLVDDLLRAQIDEPKIRHSRNFTSAREILVYENIHFDVILLDLSLPDKTGEVLIKEILAICANTPVIIITGYADFAFGIKSLSLGISDYILKDELTAHSLFKSIVFSSERKRYISALEESEKKYSELFHLSPVPMWIVDRDSMRFLNVNTATINQYGYSHEQFLFMTLKDIWPAYETQNPGEMYYVKKRYSEPNSNRIVIHKRKNGEMRNVEVKIASMQYRGVNANMVIATDITERLNYIKAIERQNKKLREISWLQSHIIRAPLCRIMGLVPLIRDKNYDAGEEAMMMRFLMESANELDEVIKNIVDRTNQRDLTY